MTFEGVTVGTFIKKATLLVPLRQAEQDEVIQTKEGKQAILAGMWIATGVEGEEWGLGQDAETSQEYKKYYLEVKPGLYRKIAPVVATRMIYPATLERREGENWGYKANKGDWFVVTDATNQYFCDNAIFEETYQLIKKIV